MSRLYRRLVDFLATLYIDTMRRAGELIVAEAAQHAADHGQTIFVAPEGAMGMGKEKSVEN